jgi:hypothetical protein
MSPRKEDLKTIERMLSHLKTFPRRGIIVETLQSEYTIRPISKLLNCKDFYPDVEGLLRNDLPTPKKNN